MPRVVLLAALLAVSCNGTPAPTPTPPAAAAAPFAGVAAALARGEAPETTSVLVMRAGEVVHEAYFGGATAETLHDTRSVGKSFTALAVGIAIEKGLLPGLDAKVFRYFDDLRPFAGAGPLKDGITIEDFLTMSSALDCDDDDEKSPGNEANMYPRHDWTRWVLDLPTRADYQRDASGRGRWHYCTAGTFLLGQVIQRAAKRPVDAFFAEHLFAPLGITRWEFVRSPTGEVMTGGMLRLRTRDFAAIAWMVRSGGEHGGKQVVPRAFVDAALTIHRNAFQNPRQDYGYLFWHRAYRTRCGDFGSWFVSGNGGNVIAIVDALDAVIVVTRTHYNHGRAMHDQTASLIERHILPDLACPAASDQ